MLDRLAKFDYEDKPVTKAELKVIFNKLADYYYESDYDEQLTVTISDIKTVLDRLANVDGLPVADLDGRNPDESATVEELTYLLDTLSQHYASGPGMIEDLDSYASASLVDIFETMEEYYTFDGSTQKDAGDLWLLYDYLTEIFGKPSDFDLGYDEVEELYKFFESSENFD